MSPISAISDPHAVRAASSAAARSACGVERRRCADCWEMPSVLTTLSDPGPPSLTVPLSAIGCAAAGGKSGRRRRHLEAERPSRIAVQSLAPPRDKLAARNCLRAGDAAWHQGAEPPGNSGGGPQRVEPAILTEREARGCFAPSPRTPAHRRRPWPVRERSGGDFASNKNLRPTAYSALDSRSRRRAPPPAAIAAIGIIAVPFAEKRGRRDRRRARRQRDSGGKRQRARPGALPELLSQLARATFGPSPATARTQAPKRRRNRPGLPEPLALRSPPAGR